MTKAKKLTTAEFIEYMKREVKRDRLRALVATDPEKREAHERKALAHQITVERLQRIYGTGVCNCMRKF